MNIEKSNINVIIFGDINSGKSTSIGHLISNCTNIDKNIFQQYENDLNQISKNEYKYIWILEKLKREYEYGDFIDMSLWKFETKNNSITIIDVPGHCNFIKNIIIGFSQIDCAILIVSANIDEFEISISNNGQTFQHIQFAQILSIEQMIIVINKMDITEPTFSEKRFEEIKRELINYIEKINYKPINIIFIPISGFYGDNLFIRSENMPWFTSWNIQYNKESIKGTTILEALDAIHLSDQLINKPLRLPLSDIYKIGGIGTVPVGRVATGILKPNMIVNFAPSNLFSKVKSIEMGNVFHTIPGDYTGFNVDNITIKELQRGFVCSDLQNDPAQQVTSIIAYIVNLNHSHKIIQGYRSILYCHTAHVICEINELIEKINRRSGKIIEKKPKYLKSKEIGLVKIIPLNPICHEKYSEYPSLGRFLIRDMEQIIIVGIIVDVEKKTNQISNKINVIRSKRK